MIECIKNMQHKKLLRNFGCTCLLLASAALAATLFFSCSQDASGGDQAVNYTVEHWTQEIDGITGKVCDETKKDGSYNRKDSEVKTGKIGEKTTAAAKEYEGFEAQSVVQQTIQADGKTVVKIYYVRKEVTLTFMSDGGKPEAPQIVKGRFGENKVGETDLKDSIVDPVRDDMQFVGWKPVKPASFPEKDTVYTAQWKTPQAGTYTVIHWKQRISGDIYDKEEEQLSGTIDDDTAAVEKTYQGFHLSKSKHPDGTIKQEKIQADDKTVINIYYDRDEFTAICKPDNGTDDIELKGRFEASLIAPPNPTKEGKVFDGWNPPLPPTFIKNTTHTAQWKDPEPKTKNYTVEHWQQQVDGTGKVYDPSVHSEPNYTRRDSETKYGKVGQQTTASANPYPGYEAQPIEQKTILAVGETVVKIYYVRKEVTLTFEPNGGKFGTSEAAKKVKGRFGETIQQTDIDTPVKDTDEDFDDWQPQVYPGNPFPAKNETYTAQWKKVKELEIRKGPDKTTYSIGESFDKNGLEVYVKYNNSSIKKLADTEYTVTGFDSTTAGTKTVTVTYKGKSTSFTVTVNAATPPAETYAVGDIIDKDKTKYKIADFAGPAAGKTWQDYYVIISVAGTKYVGVQYETTSWGSIEVSYNAAFTYNGVDFSKSGNRLMTKEEVHAIVDNKATFIAAIKKTGCTPPDPFDNPEFTGENILYNEDGTWYDGEDVRQYGSGTFLPIAARTFE